MTVKANWHVELSGMEADDPFGPSEAERIEDVGKPIDLHAAPQINERLVELLNAEAALYEANITCPVKDAPDACCSACPIRHSDEFDPLTPLCRVGVEQERLLTMSRILRARPDDASRAR